MLCSQSGIGPRVSGGAQSARLLFSGFSCCWDSWQSEWTDSSQTGGRIYQCLDEERGRRDWISSASSREGSGQRKCHASLRGSVAWGSTSDNSLSHIPRDSSIAPALSGRNVSHPPNLVWARELHPHTLCFSVPGTQTYSQLVPVLPRQALNVDKCVSHHCVTPGNTPYPSKPSTYIILPLSQVSSQNSSSTPLRQAQGHYLSPLKDHPRSKWIARKFQKGTKSCTLPWLLEIT